MYFSNECDIKKRALKKLRTNLIRYQLFLACINFQLS